MPAAFYDTVVLEARLPNAESGSVASSSDPGLVRRVPGGGFAAGAPDPGRPATSGRRSALA